VPDETIERVLRSETIDIAATELIGLALEAGGYDNVSVVIAEFVAEDEPMDDALSCADGRPQIIGAATSQPRARTGNSSAATAPVMNGARGSTVAEPDLDPEELRYAPRPVPRRRWVRWLLVTLVILGLIGGASAYAYDWS